VVVPIIAALARIGRDIGTGEAMQENQQRRESSSDPARRQFYVPIPDFRPATTFGNRL
jgi:hypothetical protein